MFIPFFRHPTWPHSSAPNVTPLILHVLTQTCPLVLERSRPLDVYTCTWTCIRPLTGLLSQAFKAHTVASTCSCRRFLNWSTVVASMTSSGNWFHLFTTRWLKKNLHDVKTGSLFRQLHTGSSEVIFTSWQLEDLFSVNRLLSQLSWSWRFN